MESSEDSCLLLMREKIVRHVEEFSLLLESLSNTSDVSLWNRVHRNYDNFIFRRDARSSVVLEEAYCIFCILTIFITFFHI